MNKKREPGWYWVKVQDSDWVISHWSGVLWAWKGCAYPDQGWEVIDENRLEHNK